MIQLSVSVKMVDRDAATYPVTPRVQVDFERHFKTTITKAFSQDPSMEHLYWLGWKSMHASGEVVKDFDGWLNGLESVSPDVDGDVPLEG
jgi:hypothetical protein